MFLPKKLRMFVNHSNTNIVGTQTEKKEKRHVDIQCNCRAKNKARNNTEQTIFSHRFFSDEKKKKTEGAETGYSLCFTRK